MISKPFPKSLRYDESFDWWRGTIKLPKFRDVKITAPGRKSTSKRIELRVELDEDEPTEAQAAAYTYLLDHAIWKARPDGSQRVRLSAAGIEAHQPHWSPDGSSIVFAGLRNPGDKKFSIGVIPFTV